ncbi:MAG: carbohydrate-binding domain-containing protein [Oscillospiraceae bacterium]|nr:carbohydrate-binding domain-containing protein [Oscillospiraceae bacterium]
MTTTRKRDFAFTAALVVMALLIGLMASPAYAAAPTADVTFTFTDSGVTASESGSGWEISGTSLTITASGTYLITGSASEGSVKVKKNVTDVTLVLSDLTLASSSTAPVVIGKGADVTIYTLGTVTLTDKEDVSTEDTNTDFEGAAIKVKSGATLTLTGTGTLNADGTKCKNAIKGASEAVITIAGGTINAGAANNGIASDGELIITGGTVNVAAASDGIKADPDDDDTTSKGSLTILGGTITVSAGDDAIKALYDLTIGTEGASDGPSITVTKSYEALEGARIYLNSGSGSFTASDDGINAATSRTANEIALYINGGTWFVNSDGDGLDAGGDSNLGGSIYMNGGTMIVLGAANSGNGAIDYDSTGTFSGGTILAVGTNGMAQTLGGEGTTFSTNVTKGTTISVKDSSGAELVSTTAQKSANHIYFASDAVSSGDTVSLYLNGTKSATATIGTTTSGGGMMGGFGGGMMGGRGQMGGMGGQMPSGDSSQQSGGMMGGRGMMGGMQGQRPDMSGEAPADGEMPEMPTDGEMPQGGFFGRGGMSGEAPSDGEMPQGDFGGKMGGRGQMGTNPFGGTELPTENAPTDTAPSADEAPAVETEVTETEANAFIAWLQSIINYLKNLFNIQ